MSSYEDYTKTSGNYDRTRVPVGVEITLGCLALAGDLGESVLLDAGCGTGNYALALLPHVGKIEAVDLNPAMISVAKEKVSRTESSGRISFYNARIDELPFADGELDGAMINQVLHHLPDDALNGYPEHRAVVREVARVLKPGATFAINTCSRTQLEHGYWYYDLIPALKDELTDRYAPTEVLINMLKESGFEYRGSFAPTDATTQGESYLHPRGPLEQTWRDGDSIWSLASEAYLQGVLAEVREMDRAGTLEKYVSDHDARRSEVGQVTVLHAVRTAD